MSWKIILLTPLACLLLLAAGCSSREQVYEGMYRGMQSRQEMIDDSQDPPDNALQDHQTYQQYKREREEMISGRKTGDNEQ